MGSAILKVGAPLHSTAFLRSKVKPRRSQTDGRLSRVRRQWRGASGTPGIVTALHRHQMRKKEEQMAAAKKTTRGRKQDRARVAGGQKYEVGYEAKKTGRSVSAVKKAVKKVGNSRKRVEKRLGR